MGSLPALPRSGRDLCVSFYQAKPPCQTSEFFDSLDSLDSLALQKYSAKIRGLWSGYFSIFSENSKIPNRLWIKEMRKTKDRQNQSIPPKCQNSGPSAADPSLAAIRQIQ